VGLGPLRFLSMAHKHLEDYDGKYKIKEDNFWADRTDRPFAIGNTIRIPTGWLKERPAYEYRARMAHELVHLEQQGFSNFYGWFVYSPKWLISKKFRAITEMEAFWVQMECYRDCEGLTILYDVMKNTLTKKYMGAFSDKLADAFLRAFEIRKSIKDWGEFYEDNK